MNIKKFNESLNDGEIEIGDYVICDDSLLNSNNNFKKINDFISSSIGKYVEYEINISEKCPYTIKYYNIPQELNDYFYIEGRIRMKFSDIKYWSKDKKELEIILNSNKFNI